MKKYSNIKWGYKKNFLKTIDKAIINYYNIIIGGI